MRIAVIIFVCLIGVLLLLRLAGNQRDKQVSEKKSSIMDPSPKVEVPEEVVPSTKPNRHPEPQKSFDKHQDDQNAFQNPARKEQHRPPPPGNPVVMGVPHPSHQTVKAPWAGYEKRINRLVKDRDIDNFSRQVRAKNLAPYVVAGLPYFPASPDDAVNYTSGEGPKPVGLDKLVGSYEGEIRFDDGKRIWQVTLELSGRIDEQKLKGEAAIEFVENGSTITKTTQKGELTLLRKVADNSVGILLAPTDTHYFQLYYLRERDMLAGNYYEKKGPGLIAPIGAVRLSRRTTAKM
ncbi:MAG: hypothetical protein HY537_10370 [Deltaproteobacteria bacterium]|nr:hypothetical protein [Deltaproteobacteria bacterium]